MTAPASLQKRFVEVDGAGVIPLAVKDAENGGTIVRLANTSTTTAQARVRLSGKNVIGAFRTNTLEADQQSLPVREGWATVEMPPRSVAAIHLKRNL